MVNPLNDYGVFTGRELMCLQLPPRKPLMGQWLLESSITLLYAPRGVGKSNFALGLAMALAKGEPFAGYENATRTPVLLLDGEMPPYELQRRLKAFSNGLMPEALHFYSTGLARFPLDSLSTLDGQEMVERFLEDIEAKVLILDNKSTLMQARKENDAESWEETQRWLIRLRNAGLAVILVHHAGKSGQQRGSSMVEVTPDIIIKLDKSKNAPVLEDKSSFVLTFEKNRHLVGKELAPRLITLQMTDIAAAWEWEAAKISASHAERARELSVKGLTQRAIAEELGVSLGAVNKYLK